MKKLNNINYLETKIDHVLETNKGFVTKESRVELFNVFNKLAQHILATEYGLAVDICGEIAVGYSIGLVDKVVMQNWGIVRGFEFTNYMRVDLEKYLKVPFTENDMRILKSLEGFNLMPDETLLNYEIFCEINDLLLQFFDLSEIKRYLPLFMVNLSSGKLRKIVNIKDVNFKYFSMLLISLIKKVSKYYVDGPSSCNYKDLSLGELTYLLSPTLKKYPELSLNLDLSSLRNLIDSCGGMQLTVPTKEELDCVLTESIHSIGFPTLSKKEKELEKLGIQKSQPCKDTAFEFFLGWLKSNKKALSPAQVDRLFKLLS